MRISLQVLRCALPTVLAVCCQPAGHAGEPPGEIRPNVVLVSIDTVRADHLSLYGYGRETSPNLDRIARNGIVFETAISQASSTTPSHRSIFLSRYASASRHDAPMLAQILKASGYETAAFTGGGMVNVKWGFGAGFDTYFESHGRRPSGASRSFEEIMPKLESWLAAPRTRPFFLFIHSYDVHHPYDAPAPYGRHFCGDYDGQVNEKQAAVILERTRHLERRRYPRGEVTVTETDRRQIEALYDGGILYADSYLARIEALLKQAGQWDRTMLVVLSDHGEEFWDHGSVLHSHTVYQELVHVPLVIRLPEGRFAGRRIEGAVQLMDVAPTILEELGLPPQASHQGKSLLPMIQRQGSTETVTIVSEIKTLRSYLKWPVKMIENRETGVIELFNLAVDPRERDGLVGVNSDELNGQLDLLKNEVQSVGSGAVNELESSPESETLKEQLRALGYIE